MTLNIFTSLHVCVGSECGVALNHGEVTYDVPWGQTRNVVVYCCFSDGTRCNSAVYDRQCDIPGIGIVACRCSSRSQTLIADRCTETVPGCSL